MKTAISTLAFCVAGIGAQAAVLDFTDNVFAGTPIYAFTSGTVGPIEVFSETVNGVTFTFSGSGGRFREVGPWGGSSTNADPPWGLSFGGGGGNASVIEMTASHDVMLNSYTGHGPINNSAQTSIFDVTGYKGK